MSHQQVVSHQVGVWIDHREAFVVFSNEPTIKEHSISSGIEKHIALLGRAQSLRVLQRINAKGMLRTTWSVFMMM